MLDNKGNLYFLDAIFALILVLVAVLVVNVVIVTPNPSLSHESSDFIQANDIMEILDGKINFSERTFIGDISKVLEKNKNSKKSVNEVGDLCSEKFKSFGLNNYCFKENNILKGKVLADSGDIPKSANVSQATSDYGDYSYTLYVW